MPKTANPEHDPLNQGETGKGRRKPIRQTQPGSGTFCGAVKSNKLPCQLSAGFGTDHLGFGRCVWHGGKTETGRRAAAKDQAAGLIKFYGSPVDTNPVEALLDEVRRTAGHVAFLGDRIANWPNDQLGEDGGLTPALDGWVKLYQSERKHLVDVSRAALSAGINERLVQLAEHQGTRLADAVEAILGALQLTPQQWDLVPQVVPAALRGLSVRLPAIEGEVVDETT